MKCKSTEAAYVFLVALLYFLSLAGFIWRYIFPVAYGKVGNATADAGVIMGTGQTLSGLWIVTGLLMLVTRRCMLVSRKARTRALSLLSYTLSSFYACIFVLQCIITGADLALFTLEAATYGSTVGADFLIVTSQTLLAVLLHQPTPQPTPGTHSEKSDTLEVPLYTIDAEGRYCMPDYSRQNGPPQDV